MPPSTSSATGVTIERLPLDAYWGPAQVVTVHKPAGPLVPEDFQHVDLSLAPRLLVRSGGSTAPHDVFPAEFVYPSPALAEALGRAGIVLYGSDTPSMDHADSKDLPGHNALLAAGVAILEGLDLRGSAGRLVRAGRPAAQDRRRRRQPGARRPAYALITPTLNM